MAERVQYTAQLDELFFEVVKLITQFVGHLDFSSVQWPVHNPCSYMGEMEESTLEMCSVGDTGVVAAHVSLDQPK